ncbi:MAG: phosphotransferase [Acidimicrobiia bacterium]|nr:phosphotransferase [Acidimicrobiia bacterium]
MTVSNDHHAVKSWLEERVHQIQPPLKFSVMAGGKSNLTYRIDDSSGRRWILRRPPLHGVIPSAHDMAREHRIISSLLASGVPVPETIGYEPDESLIGAPFFVMEYVDGHVLRHPDAAMEALSEEARRNVGTSMVRALHALHAVRPNSVGLGDLSRKDQYLARQLRAWGRQLDDVEGSLGTRIRLLRKVRDRLADSIPVQQQNSIVHGDYRLDNVIISYGGEVRAVLDWELSTLGDPLADVATLAVYWSDPDDSFFPLPTATVASGFQKREQVVESYMGNSSLDFSRFPYYLAFASWRLGVILEGVLRRYDAGAYPEAGKEEWEWLRQSVPKLGELALDHLRSD